MRLGRLLPLAAIMAFAAPAAQAASLEVSRAWSRPTAAGTPGAGYMTLTNRGPQAEVLVSVESPRAKAVEIHRTSVVGGVATMRRMQAVPVPPGGEVVFAPGGAHLMFLGLQGPLKSGEGIPAILTFASGATLRATFAVGGPPGPEAHHH